MNEITLAKMKLKAGSISKIKDWQQFAKDNLAGIEKTLKREQITIESWFYEQGNKSESDYLYCYIRAKNLDKSIKVFRNSTDPLDVYHQNFMDSVVESSEILELLVDLKG